MIKYRRVDFELIIANSRWSFIRFCEYFTAAGHWRGERRRYLYPKYYNNIWDRETDVFDINLMHLPVIVWTRS